MVTLYKEWKKKKKPKVNPFKYSLAVFSIAAAYILLIEFISRIDIENKWIEAIAMIALFPFFFLSLSKLGNLAQAGKLPFLLFKEENERHNQSQ